MHLEHVALWTDDLDRLTEFYANYLGATREGRYTNAEKGFKSCFLRFSEGARTEVMTTTSLAPVRLDPGAQRMGLTHLAISTGSDDQVDQLTELLRQDGYRVIEGPRSTGDGYYESVVLDPDGNRVEITA